LVVIQKGLFVPTRVQVDADIRLFDRALRTVDRELQKETRRRMAAISRRERDRIRGEWPIGPAIGGHSRTVITSGTSGLTPYLGFQRGNPRYLYAPWIEFGGRRPRDRTARPAGNYFYSGVARARKAAGDEVYAALHDAKRRAGL
jgi:hypothetical protein